MPEMKTNKMKLKTTSKVYAIIYDKLISDTAKWHRNELTIAALNQRTEWDYFRWVEKDNEKQR